MGIISLKRFVTPHFSINKNKLSLRLENFIAASLFAFLSVFVLFLNNYEVVLNYSFVSLEGKSFVVSLNMLLSAASSFSAMIHFLICLPYLFDRYYQEIVSHTNLLRWIKVAFSLSLTVVIVSLISGVQSMDYLAFIFLLALMSVVFAMLAEFQLVVKNDNKEWNFILFSLLISTLLWFVIGKNLFTSSDINPGAFTIFSTNFLLFLLFPLNSALSQLKIGLWKDYFNTERVFTLLSLLINTIIVIEMYIFYLS
jgi:hypothetical protein